MGKEETALSVRIRKSYDLLSNAEQKVADYVMKNEKVFLRETAEDTALHAGSSPATVVRFSRTVGFKGLRDMKMFIMENATHKDLQAHYQRTGKNKDKGDLFAMTAEFNTYCLQELLSRLDRGKVEEAARQIKSSRMVYLIAVGASSSSAYCAYDSLLKLGIPCTLVTDPIFQVMSISVCHDPEGSVALCVCHSGRSRDVLEATRLAKEKGMKTIGIVGYEHTPLAEILNTQLVLYSRDHPFFSDSLAARICEVSMLSFLYTSIKTLQDQEADPKAVSGNDMRNDIYNAINLKRTK